MKLNHVRRNASIGIVAIAIMILVVGYIPIAIPFMNDRSYLIDNVDVKYTVTNAHFVDVSKLTQGWTPTCWILCNGITYIYHTHNLVTNNGHDFILCKLYNTSASITCNQQVTHHDNANYIVLSTDSAAPAVTDTSCPSTATTNGFSWVLATQSGATATGGSSSILLKHIWTGATSTTSNLQKACIESESSSSSPDILYAENTFPVTSVGVGNTLEIDWTFTYT